MDSAPFRPVPDTSGRISKIFPSRKKTIFQWYTFGQNPHTTDNLRGFLSKFNILSSPRRFNYGFHNFWHSINWLLSFFDRGTHDWVNSSTCAWPACDLRSFHASLHLLAQVQIHLQIQFLRACNHDFAEGNHFLHGLTVLIKSKIMKQKDFTQWFFPPPGYIFTPCSFMNTIIALHFRTYLFVMWKCCILLM